jgi:uncharacterized surface protein with fasciclin (FAS1) repeats
MLRSFMLASAASIFALSAASASAQIAPQTNEPDTTLPAPEVETDTTAETSVGDATVSTRTELPAGPLPAEAPATPPVAPPEGTIAAAVVANADLSSLEAALASADLTTTLGGAGPFTVFAPTNAAFELIPAGTRAQLMDPANKASLAKLLSYHVVPGNITAAQLRRQIAAGGGTANLQTVAGQTLRASLEGEQIVLMGENNSKAYIASADMAQSNGTVHVVNGILVPNLAQG